MTTDPTELSAVELATAIAEHRLSAVEALAAFLARIERLNPTLNAVVHLDAERALASARRIDRRQDPVGLLHGVPMTLKDSHRVAGMPTIVGDPGASKAPAATDGAVAERLRAAGAILVGKTNTPLAIADSQTDNDVFGRTNNPWDLARTPGGSSGGAAAALAARLTPLEVGSDIAGSVRAPAAFSGVIGLKPSVGLISGRGHVTEPVTHPRGGGIGSFATIGPMARSFPDIDLLLTVLSGGHAAPRFEPASLAIGLLPELPGLRVAGSIRDAVTRIGELARLAGAIVRPIDAPFDTRAQHEAFVSVYQAAQNHGAAWPTRSPSAARERRRARQAWRASLARHAAILMPAVMCTAFTHRPTGTPIDVDGMPVEYWGLIRYTEPFNLTGLPAVAFPVGLDANGLPIGLQLVADDGNDRRLVSAAAWLSSLVDPLPSPF